MEEDIAGLCHVLKELLISVNPAGHQFASEDLQEVVKEFISEASAQKWVTEQMRQTGVRALDFRNGASMELEPAREMVAIWVGMCRGLIQDAPNYTETVLEHPRDLLANEGDQVEMGVGLAGEPDRYVITVKRDRFDALTPHQARQNAEARTDLMNEIVWAWIEEKNDVGGIDEGDLIWRLQSNGFNAPE